MHCQPRIRWWLFTALLAVSARPLRAQIVEVPTFEVARPTVGQFTNYTDVATGPDGTIMFIWGEDAYEGGMRDAVLSRQFTADGLPLGPPVRVDASGYAFDPAISADTRGGYVAAWERHNGHCTGGDPTSNMCAVIGRRLDSTGRPVGDELLLDSWFGWPIAVAGLPSGLAFFWNDSGLQLRLYGPNGESGGPPTSVERAITYYADIKALPAGGMVTTWFDDSNHTSRGRILDAAGQPRAPSFLLSDRMAVSHVAVNPLGGFAVIGSYTDQTDLSRWSDTNRLFVRRFADDGSPLGNEELVDEVAPGIWAMFADVEFDLQGNLFAVWTEMNTRGSQLFYPPKARAFDPNGVPFGPAVSISDMPGFAASTARLANGSFVNVWEGYPAPYTGGVYANIVRLCAAGSANCPTPPPTWTPAPTRTPTPTPVPPRCGDGIVSAGEECDDGNLVDGDGCDSNCTRTRCGNRIVTGDEECDDGNQINGDGCDRNCTVTSCGNGIVTAGEECDDGNWDDGDGCESDCTLTPHHDSVVLPVDPFNVVIMTGLDEVSRTLRIQVRNADITPKPEKPGHLLQLIADDGDCPSGTIADVPDFGVVAAPDGPDYSFVPGGATRIAYVPLLIERSNYDESDPRMAQRCTMTFTVDTILEDYDNVDPTPENNTIQVELNVYVIPNPETLVAFSHTHLSTAPAPFFIVSAKPAKATLRAGQATVTKKVDVTVTTGGAVGTGQPGATITVAASDGDCPPGTVGASDFNARLQGAQSLVTLGPGKTARGKLPLVLNRAGLTSPNAKSPARCTALITSTTDGGAAGPSNHVTKLLIEVTDHNDF